MSKEPIKITNNKNLPDVIVKAAQNDTYVSLGDISVTALIDSPRIRQLKLRYSHLVTTDVEELLPSIEGTAMHNILERADKNYEIAKAQEQTLLYHRKRQKEFMLKAKKTTNEEKKKVFEQVAWNFETSADFIFKVLRKNFPEYKQTVLNEVIMMLNFSGFAIKGQIDRLEILDENKTARIIDFKKKSVWAYGDQHERFLETAQLNIYAYMASGGIERFDAFTRNEIEPAYILRPQVKQLTIIRWYRDWQKAKAISSPANKYPPTKVMSFDLTLWTRKETEAYLKERLELHAKAAQDPESVDCSPSEKWVSESDEYKVYPKGSDGGRAMRVFNNEEDAVAFVQENEGRKPLEVRLMTGKPRRCLDYCKFRPWCSQYVREYGEQGYVDGAYKVVYETK